MIKFRMLPIICAFALAATSLHGNTEISRVDEAYNYVAERSMNACLDPFINLAASHEIEEGTKTLTIAEIREKMAEFCLPTDGISPFSKPYREIFSEEEILELENIARSPLYQKFEKEMPAFMPQLVQDAMNLIKSVVRDLNSGIENSIGPQVDVEIDSQDPWQRFLPFVLKPFTSEEKLEMLCQMAFKEAGKEAPIGDVKKALEERLKDKQIQEKFVSPYRKIFNDKEIVEFMELVDTKTNEKSQDHAMQIIMQELEIVQGLVRQILDTYGIAKPLVEVNVEMPSLKDADFEQVLASEEKPAVVILSMKGCPPCRAIKPILDELAKEYEGICRFYKADGIKNTRMRTKYDIKMFPTVLFFDKSGAQVHKMVGLQDKEALEAQIQKIIE